MQLSSIFKSMFLFKVLRNDPFKCRRPNYVLDSCHKFPTASRTIPSVGWKSPSRLRMHSTASSLEICALTCFSTAQLFQYLTDGMQFGNQRLKVRFCRIMNITFTKDNRYEEVSLQNKTFLEIFRDNLISPKFSSKNGALSITVCFEDE